MLQEWRTSGKDKFIDISIYQCYCLLAGFPQFETSTNVIIDNTKGLNWFQLLSHGFWFYSDSDDSIATILQQHVTLVGDLGLPSLSSPVRPWDNSKKHPCYNLLEFYCDSNLISFNMILDCLNFSNNKNDYENSWLAWQALSQTESFNNYLTFDQYNSQFANNKSLQYLNVSINVNYARMLSCSVHGFKSAIAVLMHICKSEVRTSEVQKLLLSVDSQDFNLLYNHCIADLNFDQQFMDKILLLRKLREFDNKISILPILDPSGQKDLTLIKSTDNFERIFSERFLSDDENKYLQKLMIDAGEISGIQDQHLILFLTKMFLFGRNKNDNRTKRDKNNDRLPSLNSNLLSLEKLLKQSSKQSKLSLVQNVLTYLQTLRKFESIAKANREFKISEYQNLFLDSASLDANEINSNLTLKAKNMKIKCFQNFHKENSEFANLTEDQLKSYFEQFHEDIFLTINKVSNESTDDSFTNNKLANICQSFVYEKVHRDLLSIVRVVGEYVGSSVGEDLLFEESKKNLGLEIC